MARTKNTLAEPLELPTLPEQKITEQQNLAARMEQAFSDEQRQITLLIGERIGRRSMGQMISKLVTVTDLLDLQKIKESKQYRGYVHIGEDEKPVTVTSWEDFCILIEGRSREAIDLELNNLEALGLEMFDAMRRVGIGPRTMRDLRRLPEDQKIALIEVAKAGDKEAFVELAEEIIAKHAKEKEELTKKAIEAESTLEAARQLSAEKTTQNEQLREENIRLTRHHSSIDPIELGTKIREALAREITRVETEMLTLRKTLTTLVEHSQTHGANHEEYAAGLLCQLQRTLHQLHGEFDIKSAPDGEALPAWMREEPVIAGVA